MARSSIRLIRRDGSGLPRAKVGSMLAPIRLPPTRLLPGKRSERQVAGRLSFVRPDRRRGGYARQVRAGGRRGRVGREADVLLGDGPRGAAFVPDAGEPDVVMDWVGVLGP